MEPHSRRLPTPAHLCTKLQVPSMGSMIQVGLWVSTHLAPEAVASSAMNLLGQGLSLSQHPSPSTRVYIAGTKLRVPVPVQDTHPTPPHPQTRVTFTVAVLEAHKKNGAGQAETQERIVPKRAEASKPWFPIQH